jgi:hypothetical protein
VELAIFVAPLRHRDAVEMDTPAFLATAWSVDAVRGGTTVFMSLEVPEAHGSRSQVIYGGLPPIGPILTGSKARVMLPDPTPMQLATKAGGIESLATNRRVTEGNGRSGNFPR